MDPQDIDLVPVAQQMRKPLFPHGQSLRKKTVAVDADHLTDQMVFARIEAKIADPPFLKQDLRSQSGM